MWLLSTDRAELHWFASPEEVPDGFATLSHVWDKKEETFQDVRRIQEGCAGRKNPRDSVCEKIRRCCELAESHRYKWVWIDTCCIDKTSSTELSEAINSMFRYYALARMCYGYLRDVESPEDYEDETWRDRTFLRSFWFKRGWTLQELITPRFFLFVSKSWEVLRSKADFAEYLERATWIPAAVLRLEISHTTYSISQRMSWFGSRKTTRLEDEAYCLLGLFDIHMAPLYGEGRDAFRRLQEEIMKQSVDTTLFAWKPSPAASSFNWDILSCLLAPSPAAFQQFPKVAYIPLCHVWSSQIPSPNSFDNHAGDVEEADDIHAGDGIEEANDIHAEDIEEAYDIHAGDVEEAHGMSFSVTPHGILARIPIIQWHGSMEDIYADLCWGLPEHTAAPHRVLLRLEKDPDMPHSRVGSSSRRESYIVGVVGGRLRYARRCKSSESLTYMMYGHEARVSRTWCDVLIRDRPPPRRLPGQLSSADPHIPFVPATTTQLLVDAPFWFDEFHVQKFFRESRAGQVEVIANSPSWSSKSPILPMTTYIFVHSTQLHTSLIVIRVGECVHEGLYRGRRAATVWVTVSDFVWTGEMNRLEASMMMMERLKLSEDHPHACLEDHVSCWQHSRKRFELNSQLPGRPAVTLAFTRCPINPGGTLILDASYHEDPQQILTSS